MVSRLKKSGGLNNPNFKFSAATVQTTANNQYINEFSVRRKLTNFGSKYKTDLVRSSS